MDHTGPMPKMIPPAKATKQTVRLLVMMALEATGSMPTIECVHISWRSMVSTMAGPSMWRMNCGRACVSTDPSNAPASVSTNASST